MTCLDPLGRIRDGESRAVDRRNGKSRPGSRQTPQPQAGDGNRVAYPATVGNDGTYSLDIPLPTLAAGQVYWLQPVLVNGAGAMFWDTAFPVPRAETLAIWSASPPTWSIRPPPARWIAPIKLNSTRPP